MRLFRLNNQKLELVRDELLTIKEFKALIDFGKGKYEIEQYFIFIYHYCDYTSPYSGEEDVTRFSKAVFEADLDMDFKMDELVKNAVNKYLSIRDTPTIKSLKGANKSLMFSSDVIESTLKRLNRNLISLDKIDIDSIVDAEAMDLYNQKYKSLKDDLNYILTLVPKVEEAIKTVNKLTDNAIKDDFNDLKSKGGNKIGNRAEPKRN
jgi:hypothetical protein